MRNEQNKSCYHNVLLFFFLLLIFISCLCISCEEWVDYANDGLEVEQNPAIDTVESGDTFECCWNYKPLGGRGAYFAEVDFILLNLFVQEPLYNISEFDTIEQEIKWDTLYTSCWTLTTSDTITGLKEALIRFEVITKSYYVCSFVEKTIYIVGSSDE